MHMARLAGVLLRFGCSLYYPCYSGLLDLCNQHFCMLRVKLFSWLKANGICYDMSYVIHTYKIVSHGNSLGSYTIVCACTTLLCHITLQRRHNECFGVSNHQRLDSLLNLMFRCRSKKTSNLRVTGLWEGNSPVTSEFPAQRARNAENVSIWWRHHVLRYIPACNI